MNAALRAQAIAMAAQQNYQPLRQLINKLISQEHVFFRYQDIIEFMMRADITEAQAQAYYEAATSIPYQEANHERP